MNSTTMNKFLRSMNHLATAHSLGDELVEQMKTFKESAEYAICKFLRNHHRCEESEDGLFKFGFDLETCVPVYDRSESKCMYVTTLWVINTTTYPTGNGTTHVVCSDEDGHNTYIENIDVCDINKILEQLKEELPKLASDEIFAEIV